MGVGFRHAALFVGLSMVGAGVPSEAGIKDWFRFSGRAATVPAPVAEARVKEYLANVLKLDGLEVTSGRSEIGARERKHLDSHILSRVEKAPELAVVEVSGKRFKGVGILGGHRLQSKNWDPVRGYVAYLSLVTPNPFPGDADTALSLLAHVLGEPALFGFSCEAGPIWAQTERYLASYHVPAAAGDGVAQFSGSSGIAPYKARSDGAPDHDEIPAWVVRGLGDLIWRPGAAAPSKDAAKPAEMGVLLAITREGSSRACRITHVTGVGKLGQSLFAGGHRLTKDDEE